jgi:hypothetical protein
MLNKTIDEPACVCITNSFSKDKIFLFSNYNVQIHGTPVSLWWHSRVAWYTGCGTLLQITLRSVCIDCGIKNSFGICVYSKEGTFLILFTFCKALGLPLAATSHILKCTAVLITEVYLFCIKLPVWNKIWLHWMFTRKGLALHSRWNHRHFEKKKRSIRKNSTLLLSVAGNRFITSFPHHVFIKSFPTWSSPIG